MALINKLKAIGDAIRSKTGKTELLTLDEMAEQITVLEGEEALTYLLVDEAGTEIAAVVVDEPVEITATPNDIRAGVTAVTANGVEVGTKEIPSYQTSEGAVGIMPGKEISVKLRDGRYDYTKLQALVCALNSSLDNSVAAHTVAINDGVYAVNSTELLSAVIKDHDSESIKLGVTNTDTKPCVFRYFTYKEEY